MRAATLAVNLGFLFASFALGVATGRGEQGRSAPQLERQPVAGSSAAGTTSATEADAPLPLAEKPVKPELTTALALEKPLSWGQVAARAQGWTAAVRADQNYGAGVVVDRTGLVLTNLHVVEGTRAITVTPFGTEPAAAHLVDSDADLDVALLRLPAPLPNAADFASRESLSVGDEVLAVGSPRKMYFSVSRGMVSFPNRFLDGVEYIQTDLPINVGNSGGPLVDREGHVIGLISFILRDSQGISFALPIDRALQRFAKHLPGELAAKGRSDGAAAGARRVALAAPKNVARERPCGACPQDDADAPGRKLPGASASAALVPPPGAGATQVAASPR